MSNPASRKYYQYYNIQELSLMDNPYRFMTSLLKENYPIEESLQKNDDELRTNTWSELYKTAAYYFDNPNMNEKSKMFNNIRFNFSGILSETNNPYDLPSIGNRTELINWVCNKNNEYLEKKESPNRINCNSETLLNTFGPDYNASKQYLGSYDH